MSPPLGDFMKIKGKKIEGPNVVIAVIPRQSGDIIFKAKAVLDYDKFDALCPTPEPPTVTKPGGVTFKDVENAKYKEAVMEWAQQKTAWMVLESLKATDDLEWETVDYGKPETWDNYTKELQSSGFSDPEIARLIDAVTAANGLSQEKIDEATNRFLAGQVEAQSE